MDAPPTQAGSTRAAPPTRRSGCPANPHRRSDLVDDRFRVSRSPRQPAPKEPPTTPRYGRVERLSAITRPAISGTHAPGGTPRGNRRAVLVTSGTHAPGTPNHPLCPAQKRTPERGEGHRANYCPPSWRRSQRSLILSMKDEPARRVEGGESAP